MKTEIIAITDRSGSMTTIRDDVIGGFNTFLEEQRELPGQARMTFTQFDHEYEVVYEGKLLDDAPTLTRQTYVPRGHTALLDAIGRTLNDQGARIKAEGWADLVVVCVITDGQENASREFTREQIKKMMQHAEAHGWRFVYVAANLDAAQLATSLGNLRASSANFVADSHGTAAAYQHTNSVVGSLRAGNEVPPELQAIKPHPWRK